MRPNPVQQRLVVTITAVMTFFAGVFAATGRGYLFLATLLMLVVAWLLVAALKPGDKPGLRHTASAGRKYVPVEEVVPAISTSLWRRPKHEEN